MMKNCRFLEVLLIWSVRLCQGSLVLLLWALALYAPGVVAQEDPGEPEAKQEDPAESEAQERTDLSASGARLAARVGNAEILLSELDLSVNQYIMAYQLTPDSDVSILEIQKTVLERMITVHLANQKAEAMGMAATEEEVDARVAGVRAEIGNPTDFRLYLTVQNLTETKLREQLAQQISAEKLLQAEVIDKVEVREAEVREYYKDNKERMIGPERAHVRHIFVRLRSEMTDEERDQARRKIDGARERLAAGEDFGELAVELSEDAAAASGGDLGWVERGQVSGPFQVITFSSPVDQISEVVATDYGYHILQVLEKQEAGVVSLEEARAAIEYEVLEGKRREAVQRYLANLRSSTEVHTYLPGDEDAGS
jgi:parvulin-like peptidyl-prolyl isomerase